MQKIEGLSNNSSAASLRLTSQQSLRRMGLCSQISTGQQSSPVVFPEKRNRAKCLKRSDGNVPTNESLEAKRGEHRIDIGDEKSDLLGYEVFSGKLVLDKGKKMKHSLPQSSSENTNQEISLDAKLTSKALIWGVNVLLIEDIISVSNNLGFRHFTVHSYPIRKGSCFRRPRRDRRDFRFLASTSDEALQWLSGFADQQCFVNCMPHPLVSSKKASSDFVTTEFPPELYIKSKSPPNFLVILNPRSGRGRSSKVFHSMVEPIFKLAGFKMEVVKTTSAGHARSLAYNTDFNTCPDGIICVGGDGIVNEVLNGLLSRDNQREAISIPIGIIPAGSDNSLVWTVLGVRDPISAAISIVKGGLTTTDVFSVEWIQTGVIHFGMTVSYYGFVTDVLELSEKYQKRFGPLRYFVAGFLKFLCLPNYTYELEYLPASKEISPCREVVDMSELYTDIMKRDGSNSNSIPRASSLSSIDSIMTPSRDPNFDTTTCSSTTRASTEPSDYVRGLDPKSKRLSSGRSNNNNCNETPEVISHSLTPNWVRTRSKSRAEKGWSGLTHQEPSRCSLGNDKEDISSTMSDPGPIWDAEPKWDAEPPVAIELGVSGGDGDGGFVEMGRGKEGEEDDKWMVLKGEFLGILVCNHSCKTVQSLSSQVVAPKAEHDDGTLDLLLVRGRGRLRLLRFFLLLQLGRHLSLPYVEYLKVKSVKIKPGKHTRGGCGIDGELIPSHGQAICCLLPDQCRLIGRPHHDS